ncbi:MAG: metallopeptidase family protein [Rhodospirillum sp.]|nr:metallopeptidase family protein [Rhodospirillum sp.]MCF8487959.1 metallopeptidase family protein [Rhodospirillum sp.]MCF8499306.1 metallopeptidase family protein [Rhodospirillum sp.]
MSTDQTGATPRFTTPPTLADMDEIARAAFDSIPPFLRDRCADVVVRIEEFPDEEVQQAMGLENPFELLGLYHGVSLDQKSIHDLPRGPDMVFLYRSPLLDYWIETGEDLTLLVRHVLIHEIGHHFGFSDADMEGLDAMMDEE